jgi:hypothetical protein
VQMKLMQFFADLDCKERFRYWLSGKCLGFDVYSLPDDVYSKCLKVGGV